MRKNLVIGVVLCASALCGCAHDMTSQRLDEKLAGETVESRAEVKSQTDRLIEQAPGLSEAQRKSLEAIRDQFRAQDDSLRGQSNKLKALLVEDLLKRNYDSDEVNEIKSRITDVENQRLTLLFKAIREANVTMNRWPSRGAREADEFYRQMMEIQMQWY